MNILLLLLLLIIIIIIIIIIMKMIMILPSLAGLPFLYLTARRPPERSPGGLSSIAPQNYTIPYCSILCYMLCYVILYYTILYYTIL